MFHQTPDVKSVNTVLNYVSLVNQAKFKTLTELEDI